MNAKSDQNQLAKARAIAEAVQEELLLTQQGVLVLTEELERRLEEITTELRGREVYLSGLIEAIPDGVIVSDEDGRIVFVNPAAERLFGYPQEQLIGQMVDMLVPQPARHAHAAQRAEYMTNPTVRAMRDQLDLHAVRADGTEFPVAICLGYADLQDGRLVIATAQDLTASRQRDRTIKELNERLLRDNADLDAVNKELEAFSYSVSHDLRSPLRAIDGFSRVLQEDHGEQLDEEGSDCTARIRKAAQRMAALIDDMLDLSRITRGNVTRSRVDVSAIANEVADALQASEPERNVEFEIGPGVIGDGDSRLLRIALDNLLGNAWKFTSRRSPAHIEFGQKQIEGSNAYFVRDNGAGFDMAYAGKLFGAFQRLHDASDYPGTGIGLATLQRIIHKHGGRVWAESEPEKGATFYFTLQ